MKRFRFHNSFAFNIVAAMVLLLVLFGVVVSLIGYFGFTNSLTREYTEMGYRAANTAVTLVDGDRIDNYLAVGEGDPDYDLVQQGMDVLCNRLDLTLIYVIKVDTSDYNSFVSVFNSVNRNNTRYSRWEAGYFRETTNDTYRRIYRDLCENGLPYATTFRTTKLNGAEPHLTVLVPVQAGDGRVTAVLCVQRPMLELVNGRKPYLRNVIVTTILLSLLVAIVVALYIRRQFVAPLHKVTQEAERFAKETSAPPEQLASSLSRISEIASLVSSVNTMETNMLRYIGNLTAFTAEKERIGTELEIARQIQVASIPSVFPPYPDRTEFDIFASMTPAKEVGGDFYDFFLVDDDHLALVMADVSGKGVPAALFMMVTKILLNERAMMGESPGEVLAFVNNRICEHNEADMFVTVWMGIYEISTGKLVAANAGHDDPALCRGDGTFALVRNRHGPVIGAVSGMDYSNYELQLEPGDKLFLYTDGVPEATDGNERMFTMQRMLDALNSGRAGSPKTILETVWSHVTAFVGDAPQFDDLTMLCMERKQADADIRCLTVEAAHDRLETVNAFVDAFLEARDCPMKLQMQIDLCVEEIFVNIANYAYGDKSGNVEIRISETDGVVTLTFADRGTPYDPLKRADPDVTLSAEERQIGGLGIFLVKKTMDTVSYRYENGKNILTMSKALHGNKPGTNR